MSKLDPRQDPRAHASFLRTRTQPTPGRFRGAHRPAEGKQVREAEVHSADRLLREVPKYPPIPNPLEPFNLAWLQERRGGTQFHGLQGQRALRQYVL